MAADADANIDDVAPAVLSYITDNTYPTSEATSTAQLTPSALSSLTQSLNAAQESIKSEIRSTSRAASGDIDTWIARARELQQDILKSREVAREIVQAAEKAEVLKSDVGDKRGKVGLLEGEVGFLENVRERLEGVRRVKGVLGGVQDALGKGDVVRAGRELDEAEEVVSLLGLSGESGVGLVLERRMDVLRDGLRESVVQGWREKVVVQIEGRSAVVKSGLDDIVAAAKGLGLFDGLLGEFARAFERAIVKPRMSIDRSGKTPTIDVSDDKLVCSGSNEDSNLEGLTQDLSMILDFLAERLPASVATPLSESLLPTVCSRLEEEWLQPAIPLEISEMPAFQEVLSSASRFAEKIEGLGWAGSQALRDWVQGAARYWLTKRREALLGDVRNLVFTGLRETKTVERVETQMVSNDDALGQNENVGDDEWDTAWEDESTEEAAPPSQAQQPLDNTEEDDDTSAWDVPDDDEPAKKDGDDEEDAWGWGDGGDDNANTQPAVPQPTTQHPPRINGQQAPTKPSQREMTLRETFTVTGVPDGILELLQQVIKDAQTLAGPEYAATPIAAAAAALYTLPTLALAIYRATAPTAYNKLSTGNMLIYNDANRLSDQLHSWQASQPSASRLRLDNDVKALGDFAKRAYSAEMDSQRTILTDLLDGAQGFSNSTSEPYKSECTSAISQTTDRLREVHRQWTPILSSSALLQSTGSLLSTITTKIILEIEELPDIGEAESKQLKLFCDVVASTNTLFMQTTPDGEERDMTMLYCPNWLKFLYLGEILESSLADIRHLWREAGLGLEFEKEEIVGLVEALFAESALRRGAIADIRRG